MEARAHCSKLPRICAHRGFNTAAPENTLPAFAMAIALGADEIEFDLWPSADGELIITHDASVDRTSNGSGRVCSLTYAELSRLDVGSKFSPSFAGLGFTRFEELMQSFAGRTVMNIHIKSVDKKAGYDAGLFMSIVRIIKKYRVEKSVYISGDEDVLEVSRSTAPELSRCCLSGRGDGTVVEKALKYGCERLQFNKEYFTLDQLERAHENGIICNMFWADDPDEAMAFIKAGIDTVLTNNFWPVKYALMGL